MAPITTVSSVKATNNIIVSNISHINLVLSKVPWIEVVYTLITIIIALMATKFLYTLIKRTLEKLAKETKTRLDDILVRELELPIHIYVLIFTFWAALTIYPGMQKYLASFNRINISLVILNTAYFITKLVKGLEEWYTTSKRFARYTHNYLIVARKLINATIYIIAIIIVLAEMGIEISPLVASLGIGGLAVALAFQDTLANYFSGIYVSTDKDLNIGDYIEIPNKAKGWIEEIGWRSSKIKTWDGNLILIPNKLLAESLIINYSKPKEPITIPLEVAVSYNTKSDKVIKTLESIIKSIKKNHPDLLTDKEPTIRIDRFDDSNIIYKVFVEVKDRDSKYKFMGVFNKAVAEAYEKGKLSVDYPVVKLMK